MTWDQCGTCKHNMAPNPLNSVGECCVCNCDLIGRDSRVHNYRQDFGFACGNCPAYEVV